MHFGVGTTALVKIVSKIQAHLEIIFSISVVYVIFAIPFAYVFKTNTTQAER